MTHKEIGLMVKQKYPAVYDEYDDADLGRAYAEKYGIEVTDFRPSKQRFDPGRKLFASLGAKREFHQTDALSAQLTQEDIKAHGLDRNKMAFDTVVLNHNFQKASTNLSLEAQVYQTEVLKTVAEAASQRELSLTAYDQIRTSEEEKRIDLVYKQHLNELELDKLDKETKLKIEAAMRYNLMDKERALFLTDTILKLIEQQHVIIESSKPQVVKDSQAQLIGEVITGFKETLRGYLQDNDRKELGGSDPDTFDRADSQPDVSEDKESLSSKDFGDGE